MGVTELSRVLPQSDKLPLSELNDPFNSMLTFLLTLRDVWKEGSSISPATRPQLSQRKLHDGEHTAFLFKLSPPVLLVLGIVWSFAATQQADPMITADIHNSQSNLQIQNLINNSCIGKLKNCQWTETSNYISNVTATFQQENLILPPIEE